MLWRMLREDDKKGEDIMKFNQFQQDVQKFLLDELKRDSTIQSGKFKDVSDLVDTMFRNFDAESNRPIIGTDIKAVQKYFNVNEEGLSAAMNAVRNSDGFANINTPDDYAKALFHVESINLLNQSSLGGEKDFSLDEPTLHRFRSVVSNLEQDITVMELSGKETGISPMQLTVRYLSEYDYSKLTGQRFKDADELLDVVDFPLKDKAKDVFHATHIGRLKNFRMDETLAMDIKETLKSEHMLEEYREFSTQGEIEFQRKAYQYYQQAQTKLANYPQLEGLSFGEFKSKIYDKDLFSAWKNGHSYTKRGNPILHDILPAMEYHRYERYKGIPLDVTKTLAFTVNSTRHVYEVGKTVRDVRMLYHGTDKKHLESIISRSVAIFRSQKDAPEYLRETALKDPKLSEEGKKLLDKIVGNYIYMTRVKSREKTISVSRKEDKGMER